MPFLHTYLVDGAGNYVVNNGSRIIVQSYEYGTTGFDWQRIASSTKKPPFIRSFDIKKFDNGATWLLKVNQQMLIGLYPSQDAALQVLRGLFIRCNASQESADVAMSHQLSKGQSTIDQALNNLVLNLVEGNDFNYILSDSSQAGNIGLQTSLNGTTWSAPVLATAYDGVANPFEFLQVDGYDAVAENSYYRGVFYDDSDNIITFTSTKLKDEADPSGILSVLIQNLEKDGPPEATWDGQTYAGAAYATPQWTVEDWPQGVSPAYTYAWSYQLDNGPLVSVGGSGSTLDLSLVPYGATLKCGAVATAFVNGKIVGSASPAPMVTVAVSEEIPVSFVTDPGADTTNPQVPASVATTAFTTAGTAPITTTYVWKRGSATIAGASSSSYTSQAADVGSVLTCIVTINNAFGPSKSRTVNFGTVQAESVQVNVQYIKLFTGQGPSGSDVTDNPPANTQLYAYAYSDLAGTQLITGDVTWLNDSAAGVVATFTGTPSASEQNPTEGAELSITDSGRAGNPAPSISYLWSDGSTGNSLNTTGMVGDAISCTVTASNGWSPDAVVSNITFGTVQGASGPTGLVQSMTWTFSATQADRGTLVSTGIEVINPAQLNSWNVNGGPRFWNGAYAEQTSPSGLPATAAVYNSGNGRYEFTNSIDTRAWWESNWQARVRLNGGAWLSCDEKTNIGTIAVTPAAAYNNVGDNAGASWPVPLPRDLAPGDILDIEIYAKGDLPS
jgi:hypothetical protein